MFWNKKFEKTPLEEEIKTIKAKINRIETDMLDLMQGQALIRDKIMRKMRLKHINDEENEADTDTWAGIPKAKSINTKAF